MMIKNKLSGVLLLVLLLSGCQTQDKTAQTVSPIDKGAGLPTDAIIYSLPRTILMVDAVAEKVIKKKGPLSDYGKKYLGLEGGIKEDRTEWFLQIKNVTASEETDPDQYYMIRSNGLVRSNFLKLTENGLVLFTGSQKSDFIGKESREETEDEDIAYFKDLSVKPNLVEKSDTVYSLLETDTGFVKVPHVQLKNRYKTLDEKAAEAAAFIIKIRKRRFKLLSGQYDVFPEGIALEYAVNEMTRLENEYLSLFIGKTITKQVHRTYTYLPKGEKDEISDVLFRFSSVKGFLPEKDLTGSPVTISVKKLNSENPFKSMTVNSESEDVSDLIYRIPVPCQVEISDEVHSLGSTNLFIYQLGPLVRLPDNVDLSPEK